MTFGDNNRVRDLFDAMARDWTPASADHGTHVLYAPLSPDPEISRLCATVLSCAERQKADRFITKDGRDCFIQRRAFRRYCSALASGSLRPLSKIIFEETENGRPYLRGRPDLWFSFSSCRSGFIGAWSLTHAIGVDIGDETVDFNVSELAHTYFTESELRVVEKEGPSRFRTFLRLWCLKEAALKSIGEGLPFGLDAFEFDLDGDLRIASAPEEHGGLELFGAYLFDRPDVCAALVLRTRGSQQTMRSPFYLTGPESLKGSDFSTTP